MTSSATLRSGWPISDLQLQNGELVAGSFNAMRLPNFASLDVRASRTVATERGELDWYFEVVNLLNRENYCCVDYSHTPANGSVPASLAVERDDLLGIVPNIGLRWQF